MTIYSAYVFLMPELIPLYLRYCNAYTYHYESVFIRLFAGIVPRVTWISIGGFIFFGAYEKSKEILIKSGL